jgi:hypothetical protein
MVQYKQLSDTTIPLPLDDVIDIHLRPNELKMIVENSKHFTDEIGNAHNRMVLIIIKVCCDLVL